MDLSEKKLDILHKSVIQMKSYIESLCDIGKRCMKREGRSGLGKLTKSKPT